MIQRAAGAAHPYFWRSDMHDLQVWVDCCDVCVIRGEHRVAAIGGGQRDVDVHDVWMRCLAYRRDGR